MSSPKLTPASTKRKRLCVSSRYIDEGNTSDEDDDYAIGMRRRSSNGKAKRRKISRRTSKTPTVERTTPQPARSRPRNLRTPRPKQEPEPTIKGRIIDEKQPPGQSGLNWSLNPEEQPASSTGHQSVIEIFEAKYGRVAVHAMIDEVAGFPVFYSSDLQYDLHPEELNSECKAAWDQIWEKVAGRHPNLTDPDELFQAWQCIRTGYNSSHANETWTGRIRYLNSLQDQPSISHLTAIEDNQVEMTPVATTPSDLVQDSNLEPVQEPEENHSGTSSSRSSTIRSPSPHDNQKLGQISLNWSPNSQEQSTPSSSYSTPNEALFISTCANCTTTSLPSPSSQLSSDSSFVTAREDQDAFKNYFYRLWSKVSEGPNAGKNLTELRRNSTRVVDKFCNEYFG
ncbi:hypothetical protein L596_019665 [Steinernema carpocapsae]|uniref:Uncharacterized protein n=1 Tax=Steinernema carpocapsae TaxID=34508 RepID=A0A4U5MR72_STECR|nr:hypothetical protein L596_019665 [Steinernema carpocapsae]